MTPAQIIHELATDSGLRTVLGLVALDFVLGLLAAFKLGTFRLSYLADFARNDVLGKALPYSVLEVVAIVTGGSAVLGPVDFTRLAQGVLVVVVAALAGSLLNSLKDLGFSGLPLSLAGDDPAAPGAPPHGGV